MRHVRAVARLAVSLPAWVTGSPDLMSQLWLHGLAPGLSTSLHMLSATTGIS